MSLVVPVCLCIVSFITLVFIIRGVIISVPSIDLHHLHVFLHLQLVSELLLPDNVEVFDIECLFVKHTVLLPVVLQVVLLPHVPLKALLVVLPLLLDEPLLNSVPVEFFVG